MRALATIKKAYAYNFRKILKCKKGSKEHKALIKKEKELHREEMRALSRGFR